MTKTRVLFIGGIFSKEFVEILMKKKNTNLIVLLGRKP